MMDREYQKIYQKSQENVEKLGTNQGIVNFQRKILPLKIMKTS